MSKIFKLIKKKTKKGSRKKLVKGIKIFPKKKKTKTNNMVADDKKIS